MRITLTLPPGRDGDALAKALRLPDVDLRRMALSADGARPVLLAMQAPGMASYLFHGLEPGDAVDVAATLAAYRAAPAGWITDARPCGRLRFCLRIRVPAE